MCFNHWIKGILIKESKKLFETPSHTKYGVKIIYIHILQNTYILVFRYIQEIFDIELTYRTTIIGYKITFSFAYITHFSFLFYIIPLSCLFLLSIYLFIYFFKAITANRLIRIFSKDSVKYTKKKGQSTKLFL